MNTRSTAPSEGAISRVRNLLESQQLIHPSAPTAESLASVLSSDDRSLIAPNGQPPLGCVRDALETLVQRAEVVPVPGGYAVTLFSPRVRRAHRVLSMVGRSATLHKRAVCVDDVWRYARHYHEAEVHASSLTPAVIRLDMWYQAKGGTLVVIRESRGSRINHHLMVPRALAGHQLDWNPAAPLTWLDYVGSHVRALAGGESATRQGEKQPSPFTVQQLRDRLTRCRHDGQIEALVLYGIDPRVPARVTEALFRLAEKKVPIVRRIAERRGLWVLAEASVAFTADIGEFTRDADRIVEAARRIVGQSGVNVTTAEEIAATCACTPGLELRHPKGLVSQLKSLTRARVTARNGVANPRKNYAMRRLGRVGDQTTYWVACGSDDELSLAEAHAITSLRDIGASVAQAQWSDRLTQLQDVKSPLVALGRARQIRDEILKLTAAAERLATKARDMECVLQALQGSLLEVDGWLTFHRSSAEAAPTGILVDPGGMTTKAVHAELQLVREFAAVPSNNTVNLTNNVLQRPNPDYVDGRQSTSREGTRYLYDDAHVFAYIARHCGGPTCRLLSQWAISEVGELRDARFVYAALRTEAPQNRMRLVAGLGLMHAAGSESAVLECAQNDSHAGVRETALWALGMLIGNAATDEIRRAELEDEDHRVRQAASRFRRLDHCWWWRI